jgi:thioredoxin reductase/bacterioferritin-associated ferredoxin
MAPRQITQNDLIVIGAGPGGIAAAVEAAHAGLRVTILDENRKAGGRIYGQLSDGFKLTNPDFLGLDHLKGCNLLAELDRQHSRINYMGEATVFGLFDDHTLAYHRRDQGYRIGFEQLVIAAGAYERSVPFPGWTLPGVFQAGGVQTLVKMQRVLPGKNILFAGTGPLQLVVANQVLDVGGNIAAILEVGKVKSWTKLLCGLMSNWGIAADGFKYLQRIITARVPLLRRHVIQKARGDSRVEEVIISKVDKDWRPINGTQRSLSVDSVAIGYGLIPSTELTRLAGCKHVFNPYIGGWVPNRNDNLETSLPGIYAVGDGAGIQGSLLAELEGRIAGLSAARKLNRLSRGELKVRIDSLRAKIKNIQRFRAPLDELSRPRPGLYSLADDETVICRCEEVTMGQIKEKISSGITDMNEIKRLTRMGMGRCQGRMCGPILQEIIAAITGKSINQIPYLNQRPPVKPVELGILNTLPGDYQTKPAW